MLAFWCASPRMAEPEVTFLFPLCEALLSVITALFLIGFRAVCSKNYIKCEAEFAVLKTMEGLYLAETYNVFMIEDSSLSCFIDCLSLF